MQEFWAGRISAGKSVRAGLACIALAVSVSPATAATLTTALPGGNGQDGIMFDIVAGARPLTLTSLEFLGRNTSLFTMEVRYKLGGIQGDPLDSTGWVLLDSFSDVSVVDLELASLDITDFGLAAGGVLGLYITGTGDASAVEYSDGVNFGDVWASNGDLQILTGYGIDYPFAQAFSVRNFNGSISYGVIPEPASWALMIAGFGLIGGALRRRGAAAA